jgi:uncharacterized membrane protein
MKQNRFKSPVVWAAIVAQIISLGQLTGMWAKVGLDAGTIGDVAAGVIQLAVIVGILNNPENKTGF